MTQEKLAQITRELIEQIGHPQQKLLEECEEYVQDQITKTLNDILNVDENFMFVAERDLIVPKSHDPDTCLDVFVHDDHSTIEDQLRYGRLFDLSQEKKREKLTPGKQYKIVLYRIWRDVDVKAFEPFLQLVSRTSSLGRPIYCGLEGLLITYNHFHDHLEEMLDLDEETQMTKIYTPSLYRDKRCRGGELDFFPVLERTELPWDGSYEFIFNQHFLKHAVDTASEDSYLLGFFEK